MQHNFEISSDSWKLIHGLHIWAGMTKSEIIVVISNKPKYRHLKG